MNTSITEDYVSFETAKLLKEKGFDEDCIKVYINKELRNVITKESIEECTHCFNHYLYPGDAAAPTLYVVMKWLRKIYSLEIYPYHDFPKVGDKWWFEIIKYPNSVSEYESETAYNSYEEACEAAIKYCLENLI